jgi:hypothetical protein
MTSNLVLFVVLMTLDDVKLGSASKGYSSKVAAALVVRREVEGQISSSHDDYYD